jgi:hypothetical protein
MEYPLFAPTVFDQCFDQTALNAIKCEIHNENNCIPYVHEWEGENFGKVFSNRYQGNWANKKLQELILTGLPSLLAENIIVEKIIHLQSFIPYEFHCDYGWSKPEPDEVPFAVIIIPLETVDARTIVLDQTMHGLHFVDYKKDAPVVDIKQQLSIEEYEKHFSHCWPQERPYISIKDIFIWKAGSAFAIDLRYIHASDNFLKNGLTEKNCISIFTKIKKENYSKVIGKNN